jgi:polyphenol oxidase
MDAETLNGVVAYRSMRFRDASIEHAFFTRLGGVSAVPYASLNVGGTVGDDPVHVDENLRRVLGALQWQESQVISGFQVHGERVHRVVPEDAGRVIPATDALVSDVPGLLLLGRYADCVPVILWDPMHEVVGLAHAGWRGTIRRIASKTVVAMAQHFGSRPQDLRVAIGPSIGPCCFEVGDEVLQAFREAFPANASEVIDRSGHHVDLWRANAVQLEQSGVGEIDVAGLCTSCHVDRFYSHRREHGTTGRFAVAIGLRAE